MTEPIFKRMQALENENAQLKAEVVRLKNDLFIANSKTPVRDNTDISIRVATRNNPEMIAQWSSKGLSWTNSNGTLRGCYGGATTRGRLETDQHWEAAKAAVYVIYAWETPISWIDRNGKVTTPDQWYSSTTTTKQKMVKASFAKFFASK